MRAWRIVQQHELALYLLTISAYESENKARQHIHKTPENITPKQLLPSTSSGLHDVCERGVSSAVAQQQQYATPCMRAWLAL